LKKKLAIYPFCEELNPILKYKNKIKDYELKYSITPKSWEIFDGSKKNFESIITEEEFISKKLIDSIDVFLLCKPVFQVKETLYENIIKLAKKHNKQLIHVSELRSIIDKLNINSICLQSEMKFMIKNTELSTIDIPIAMVLGFGENCEKWDVQMGMQDYFNKKGYKVSLISSNPLSELMDFYSVPNNIINENIDFSQKVKKVNSFIKDIELNENPDLIIIGIPGGIIKYNQSISNNYGYLAYLICNAVTPDVSILNLYCGEYKSEYIEQIKSICFYRFGIVLNYFHISKNVCNYNFETVKLDYFPVEHKFLVDNVIKPHEILPAFNINDKTSKDKVFQKIITELQNNIAAV
jgi:peptide maturation system protein (TIGR04066 family)